MTQTYFHRFSIEIGRFQGPQNVMAILRRTAPYIYPKGPTKIFYLMLGEGSDRGSYSISKKIPVFFCDPKLVICIEYL